MANNSTIPSLLTGEGDLELLGGKLGVKPVVSALYFYLKNITWSQVFVLSSVAFVTYLSSLVFYRLYLCPTAHIPGPFLAKITYLYESYYDFVYTGKYYEKIKEAHEKYGALLESNPFFAEPSC